MIKSKRCFLVYIIFFILYSNALASSYGLGNDYSAGRTTQPSLFGVIYANPAELPLQQNAKPINQELKEFNRVKGIDIDKSKSFGWQLSSFGISLETGNIKRLKDNWDKVGSSPKDMASIYEYVDDLNQFLSTTRDDMYISTNSNLEVLSPFVFKINDQSRASIGLNWKSMRKMSLVGGNVAIDTSKFTELTLKQLLSTKEVDQGMRDKTYIEDHPEDILDTLQVTSSLYLKWAEEVRFHIGYSGLFYSDDDGELYWGMRHNLYALYLTKGLIPFKKYLKIAINKNNDTSIKDELADDFKDSTQSFTKRYLYGLDMGMMWMSKNYTFGFSILNINEPSTSYPLLGADCANISDKDDREDCYYAISLSEQINLDETVIYEMLPTVSASIFTEDRHIMFSVSQDLKGAKSPTGEAYQWFSANLVYTTRTDREYWYHYLIPDVRLGVNQNAVGSSIQYYTFGFGWYGLNLDFMIDKSFLGDTEEARGAGFSFSYGVNF